MLKLASLLVLLSCATMPAPKTWQERSDQVAEEFSLGTAERYPELASRAGHHDYDSKAIQLEVGMEAKDKAHWHEWRRRLEKLLRTETQEELLTDYRVLLEKVNLAIEGLELNERFRRIHFCLPAKNVFHGLHTLINNQTGPHRKRAAVTRLQAYVEGHGAFKPLLEACRERTQRSIAQHPRSALYPLRSEILEYFAQKPNYLADLEKLLTQSGSDAWKGPLAKFKDQLERHDQFLAQAVLPRAREEIRLPHDLYAHRLREQGISSTPQRLIADAMQDYATTYAVFRQRARDLAQKHDLKSKHPAAVIQFLKKNRFKDNEDLKHHFTAADKRLTQIIREHSLVTVPTTPLQFRFQGPTESNVASIPHLSTPAFFNNKTKRPEFFVPYAFTTDSSLDDFSFRDMAVILTAHEGRPGHDLQFSSMQDRGVSKIRARYAFNSVNVEGWGLYAEALVAPYLTDEEQFVGLQTRLWRIARALLEPQLHLGLVSRQKIKTVLTGELGISEAMAEQDIQRLSFINPGQSPTYYYGLKKILAIKEQARARLAEEFNERCFHDAFLALGLLPLEVIAERLQGLTCPKGD